MKSVSSLDRLEHHLESMYEIEYSHSEEADPGHWDGVWSPGWC